MNGKNLYDQSTRGPTNTQLAVAAVVAAWGLFFLILVTWAFFFFEERGQALEATPAAHTPVITLEPPTGSAGTEVSVQGEGWPANNSVVIFLLAPTETNVPDYAVANAVTTSEGQFTASFIFPEETRWDNQDTATVIARTEDGKLAAQANFDLSSPVIEPEETSEMPTLIDTPAAAPSPTTALATPAPVSDTLPLLPTDTPAATSAPESVPLPTEAPVSPVLTSVTDLNIRSGPGTDYPVIGLLQAGQSAEVTGLSYNAGWWQIKFAGAADGLGWVSGQYVTTQNVSNIPRVQVSPPPVPPTPILSPASSLPASPAVGIWRAEYYNNLNLNGTPALVRNEGDINFNWGTGSPAPEVLGDNYSVRWTGIWFFNEGTYRFHAVVDDGVRLYVDDALVIDNWQDGAQREVAGDRWLPTGNHTIRVEYYEHLDQALIRVWTELIGSPGAVFISSDNGDDEPEADFSVDRRSGPAPLRVEFDNDSDGDYDECDWDFGDGDDSDDCDDVSHTYHEPGTYTVWLRVEGPDGSDTERKSDYIRVEEPSDQSPQVPADWHDVLPSDWRSRIPEKYHGAVEACIDYFNEIRRPISSPPDVDSILEDCADYLD